MKKKVEFLGRGVFRIDGEFFTWDEHPDDDGGKYGLGIVVGPDVTYEIVSEKRDERGIVTEMDLVEFRG